MQMVHQYSLGLRLGLGQMVSHNKCAAKWGKKKTRNENIFFLHEALLYEPLFFLLVRTVILFRLT